MIPPRARFDRLVAWSPVLLLGCLAALTYWLDAQVQSSPPRGDGASRHDPDLYIENLSAVSFEFLGRLRTARLFEDAPLYRLDRRTKAV